MDFLHPLDENIRGGKRVRHVKKIISMVVITAFLINLFFSPTLTGTVLALDSTEALGISEEDTIAPGVIFEGMIPDGQSSTISNGVTLEVPEVVSGSKAILEPPANDRVGATISFNANNTLFGVVRYSFYFKTGSESPEIIAGVNDWLTDGHRLVIDSSVSPNTECVLEYVYNTTTAQYEIYLNGAKKSNPTYSPNPFRGMRNVTLGAYKKGSLEISKIKVTYEKYTGKEWGTYFDGVPETGLEKTQNGVNFYIDTEIDDIAKNEGGIINVTPTDCGGAKIYLEYKTDNTKDGIVRYEYTIKTSQYVPLLEIRYCSDNIDNICGEVELLPDTERCVAFVCSTSSKKWYIYVDDEKVSEGDLNLTAGIDKLCMVCTSSGAENESIKITGIRLVYEEEKEPTVLNLSTIQESEIIAKAKLGKDIIFMSNCDYYYASRKKSTYSSIGASAYMDDELGVMVTLPLVAQTLGISMEAIGDKLSVDGKETDIMCVSKDGSVFVPVAKIARDCLSRYVYEDTRGFVLISTQSRGYSNSQNSMDTLETSDYIYRYMQFERPDGDRIYEDVRKNSYKSHPRMFIKKDEIEAFRERIKNVEELNNYLPKFVSNCEYYYRTQPTKYEIPDGLRLFNSCYKVRLILTYLGMGYIVTGNEKYRDRMWIEVQNALSWKDWNLENHFLDSGEIGPAIAFAYDILYDRLTPSQRQFVRDAVEELYIDFAVGVYTGQSSFSANDGRLTRTNWGAVCANSMLMCALAFIDDEPEDSEFTQKCKFLAKCALQSHEFPLEVPFPDGDISEGIGYWSYFVESLGWSIETLLNMCNTDYGLLSAPGYRQMADFELYVQTPNGIYAHCDSTYDDINMPIVPETYLIAKFYDDAPLMQALDEFREMMGAGYGAFGLLWYECQDTDDEYEQYPLNKHFSQSINVMRGDWTRTSPYLGVSCGVIHSESHLDKGSFMYENQGERWFVDIGSDNYNIDGYHSESGYRLYRKRAEGHNTLVINPTAEEPDQILYSSPTVTRFESGTDDGIIVCDLTDSYRNDVLYYNRGFYMDEGKNTLVVQDELEFLNEDNDIYYFLHTEGDITIHPDGRGATVTQNGKKLRLDFICDAKEWKLEARETSPLFAQNSSSGEYSRDRFKKITLVGKADGKLNISVKMRPEDSGLYMPHTLVPISQWEIDKEEAGNLEYGTVFSGLPENGLSKITECAAFETILDYPEFGEAICKDGRIDISTADVWKAVDSRLIFASKNSLDGAVKYEFKIKAGDNVPSIYVKYFSDNREFMAGEITSGVKSNTESVVQLLYNPKSGQWNLFFDGEKIQEGTVEDCAAGIDCVFLRFMSPDTEIRTVSLEDASIQYFALQSEIPDKIKLRQEQNEWIAEFTSVKREYFSDFESKVIYAIAAYKNKKLVAVNYTTIEKTDIRDSYSLTLDIANKEYDKVSAFLWTSDLRPMCDLEK